MLNNASPGNTDLQAVLADVAGKAAEPEKREPGPGDVGPTDQTKTSPLLTMPMSEEEVKAMWKRVEASDSRIAHLSTGWDILLKEYLPIVKATGEAEHVKVPKHFRNVHSKIGQVFYKTPEPFLLPKDPSPAQDEQPNPMAALNPILAGQPLKMDDIISVKQAVLQYKMGRDGINYSRLMDELLFDVLAWTGIGCSKIGYSCITKPVQQPKMVPDPTFVAPPSTGILGLGPTPEPPQIQATHPVTGEPVFDTIDVPIYEEFYERRFSPKKLITNADLRSSRIDQDAVMMGMHFYITPQRAKKAYGLTDDQVSKCTNDDKVYKHEWDTAATTDNSLLHGVELWLRASHFDEQQPHPQVIYQLVLLEGLEQPVVYRLSPDQTLDPQTGRLSGDSLLGFPIKVLTLRDLADSLFPPSDTAFTNGEVKQLNTYRRQGVEIRDAAIGHYLYSSGAFDEDTLALLKSGKAGRWIPVEEGRLEQNGAKGVLDTTAQVHQGFDNARNEQLISRDIDETLGIGAPQSGAMEDTIHTATEIATVQAAVTGRNGKELGRTVDFYLDSCRKLDQLLMRYATEDDYVHITGEDGARRMMMWNSRIISGRFIYDITPDSQLNIDMARDRKQLMDYYNLTGNDPLSNRAYLMRRLARMFGLDPMKAVLNPAQLAPMGMAPASGVGGPVAQPPHGGPLTPGAPINKHVAGVSGQRPNEPGAENHRDGQR
jgi:hypothetical protein